MPSTEAKVWHGGPVWFDNGNPIVGYWVRKNKQGTRVQLMFWSGLDFKESTLTQVGKYPTAAIEYTTVNDINTDDLTRWMQKAKVIQWDYKNIVKRKGELTKLGEW